MGFIYKKLWKNQKVNLIYKKLKFHKFWTSQANVVARCLRNMHSLFGSVWLIHWFIIAIGLNCNETINKIRIQLIVLLKDRIFKKIKIKNKFVLFWMKKIIIKMGSKCLKAWLNFLMKGLMIEHSFSKILVRFHRIFIQRKKLYRKLI